MEAVQEATLLPHAEMWQLPRWVYSEFRGVSYYVARQADLIHLAETDGISQIAPILAVFRGRPDEVRARIGKGLWKRVFPVKAAEIHHLKPIEGRQQNDRPSPRNHSTEGLEAFLAGARRLER